MYYILKDLTIPMYFFSHSLISSTKSGRLIIINIAEFTVLVTKKVKLQEKEKTGYCAIIRRSTRSTVFRNIGQICASRVIDGDMAIFA